MLRNNTCLTEAHTFNTPTFPASRASGWERCVTSANYRRSARAIMMTSRRSPARELPQTEHGE